MVSGRAEAVTTVDFDLPLHGQVTPATDLPNGGIPANRCNHRAPGKDQP